MDHPAPDSVMVIKGTKNAKYRSQIFVLFVLLFAANSAQP
jgi:hypothetical protein